MPFTSGRHHEYWTADVRHLDMLAESLLAQGMVYAITTIENYSRAVLASSLTRRQDLNAFLAVLYRVVQEYGPPEAFVTDSGSIFLANRAQAIYRALGIRKMQIEKGKPWQSYIETTFNTQRRIADHYFGKAEDWTDLLGEHDRWMADYNVQEHYAHQRRKDGRRSPSEVLAWVKRPRYRDEDLDRSAPVSSSSFFAGAFSSKGSVGCCGGSRLGFRTGARAVSCVIIGVLQRI